MKKMVLTVGVLFIIQSVYCQTETISDWIVSVNAGIEAHDKRLFDYARPEKEALLGKQPEFWGTYHFGVKARRKVWQGKRFSNLIGLGVNYENSTFLRPFDQGHFGDRRRILLLTDKYEKVLARLSLLTCYELGSHWLISAELASNLIVFRHIANTTVNNSNFFPYSESTFELDEIQLRLGVIYKVDKFIIGLLPRMVSFQKIDRIIFNHILKDPRTDQKWEWHNPLRFDLTVGYTW